jgi:hypothetical protein
LWGLSKLYWTARRKMRDIPLTGVGLKKCDKASIEELYPI